jgi:hypothetical protein
VCATPVTTSFAATPTICFLGTHADNAADMVRKGRSLSGDRNPSRRYPGIHAKGEACTSAKLTDAQVAEIRLRYATDTPSLRKLGREFGVSYNHISRIVNHKAR